MAIHLNSACETHARSLIGSGKFSHGAWDESSVPRDAEHKNCFLGTDDEFKPADAGYYKYPVISNGELNRKALGSAAGYAEKNGAPAIAAAAKALGDEIDAKDKPVEASYMLIFDRRTHQQLSVATGDKKVVGGQPVEYRWKELIYPGNFVKDLQIGDRTVVQHIDVDRTRMLHWVATGNDRIAAGVNVPVNVEHIKAAPATIGYVRQFKVDGDKLMAKFELIGPDSPLLFDSNDVSIGISKTWKDGTGKTWHDVIDHVAVTQFPIVPNLEQSIAASHLSSVDGAVSVYLSTDPTKGVNPMGCTLSDDVLKSLTTNPHLCMANMSHDSVPDHLKGWHEKHSMALSAIKREVPGMMDCQPGDEMSRIQQHLMSRGHMLSKLLPNGSEKLPVAQQEEIILSRIGEVGDVTKKLEARDAVINDLTAKNTELAKHVISAPAKEVGEYLYPLAKSELLGCNLSPHVQRALLDYLVGTPDQPNAIMCSKNASPDRSTVPALKIIEILKMNTTVSTGERTRGQVALGRHAPGDTDPQKKADEEAALAFMTAKPQ